jgi:hypothetical protein
MKNLGILKMNNIYDEGNLVFDFTACGTARRFDERNKNVHGMKNVDFIAETVDCLYFIEIKDSLLRRCAEGEKFTKKVMYLLFINLDKLGEFERGLLKTKINGHIPLGLNDARFN